VFWQQWLDRVTNTNTKGDNKKEIEEAQRLLDEVSKALRAAESRAQEARARLKEAESAEAAAKVLFFFFFWHIVSNVSCASLTQFTSWKQSEAAAKAREAEAKAAEADAKNREAAAKASEVRRWTNQLERLKMTFCLRFISGWSQEQGSRC